MSKEVEYRDGWIVKSRKGGDSFRVLCFPFAGGGASVFAPWMAIESSDTEICAVQLPGRESRIRERPFTDMKDLAKVTAWGIRPYLDRPFVFFGHSMGGLLAFEVSRVLQNNGGPLPCLLVTSACPAPQLPYAFQNIHDLPDGEFIDEIKKLQGKSSAALENKDLLELVLPMLRADFTVVETYSCESGDQLEVPILAIGGSDDLFVPSERIDGWRKQTAKQYFQVSVLGDHFFLLVSPRTVFNLVMRFARELAFRRWCQEEPAPRLHKNS
ncbi:MAG: alpha/beta fold hydrolase [Candidatus Acidiferrum sp.]